MAEPRQVMGRRQSSSWMVLLGLIVEGGQIPGTTHAPASPESLALGQPLILSILGGSWRRLVM